MEKSLRKSGIDNIRDIPWGTHFCQFYQTKEDLIDILVPYFKAGLENNEFCMWVTSQPLGVESAKEALEMAVPDIDAYLEKGQIEIIPHNYWYVKEGRSGSEEGGSGSEEGVFDSEKVLNGWIEKLNHALASGYDGLRLSGKTFGLEKEGWNGFIEYEKEIDNIIGNFHMMALCTYPLDRCHATEIIDVVINHQFALIKREGKWERIESSRRKKAEEEAAQAAKDWEYTFDIVPDLIAILDAEYGVVRANKAMAARLGVTPEECIGLTCYRVVHGMDEPPSFCPHRQLLEDGLEHTKEVREESLGGDFIVTVSPLHDSEGKLTGCIHVAHDITERKRAEEALRRSEQRVRLKLESILSPDREMANLELADIVDVQAIQSLMDDFYKLAQIPMSLGDLKGNFLVGVGWQEICTRFHRVHPEACKHCIESDTKLSAGVAPGEFKLYRCKNNMWDIATPLIVGGQHVGNILSGQFFFEDETLDYELFRAQAKKYGFNEEEYIAALEKVPRLSREAVDTGMTFFMKLAHMFSQLSYSNIKLAQSLSERDSLVDALRESEERFRAVLENSLDVAYRRNLQADCYDYMSPVVEQITGFSAQKMSAMSINEVLDHVHPDDRPPVTAELAQAFDTGHGTLEYRFKRKDGKYRWLADHFTVIKDQNGMPLFSGGIIRDITRQKQAEEALIRSENKFRTLAENSPDVISRLDRQNRYMYVNPAAAEPYGSSPEEIVGKTNSELGMDPENVRFWEGHYENVFTTGKPETMEFHYKSPQGKEYYFNTRIVPEFVGGEVSSVLAISRDITDEKEVEAKLKEAYENLEKLVEERTRQLAKAYNSLKESEKGLAEAQKMAHIGNWDWNLVTGEVYWSDELYRIFGREPQESGASFDELLNYVHPEDRDYLSNVIKKGLNGKPHGIDYRIVRASGEERAVHAQSEVIFDEENIPIRAKGIVQDITERKKAEDMLKENEGKLKALFNLLPVGVSIIDKERNILDSNLALERIMGLSRSDLLNGKYGARKYISSNGTKISAEEFPSVRALKEKGSIQSSEIGIIKEDSSIIWTDVSAISLPFSDGQVVVTTRDITESKKTAEELQKAEEKYRIVTERTGQLVYDYNIEGNAANWAGSIKECTGYTPDEFRNTSLKFWRSRIHPEDLNRYLENYDKYISSGEAYRTEYRFRKKNEEYVYFEDNGICLRDKEGNVNRILGVIKDITERKKAEGNLKTIEIARKKEIHHRIKNNLQVISSLLDLQAEKFNNRKCVKDSEIMEAFRESQNRVLSMALIHEELHEGKEIDKLKFSPYLEKLAENLFKTYSLGNADISLSLDLEENVFFDMDTAVPLGIIINELISNSLKHAFVDRDRGEIRIKLYREKTGECKKNRTGGKKEDFKPTSFVLAVSDDGIGVPESFDLKNPNRLGIQLVIALVDQLEGELELKRNSGTEFIIRFTVEEKQ
ncbi:PAS domain S-box protein [Methanosarcina sp. 2.H.A.1B.4]|uniref:PAS domain S-box protein n=1 Tax=Methanosarcina sp. 2.H.A.1B.4 TaxID=1483600 RepID=UPI000620FC6F|nr:PAS domain S-box protein [Methanosarcina sp. 2.H.A.1B.4]KKG10043.1 histidine kinase [Methanosarcina sp. 2.H.A.1B.4]